MNKRPVVLIADDDDLVRKLLGQIVEGEGCQVVSVDDGSAAWAFLQHGRYDVLLADVEMPEMSGLELVAKLRETGNNLPVVFVTGAASVAQVIPYLEFGQSWTLQKPFGIEQIRSGLRDALTTVGCWKEGPLWRRAEIGSA